MQKLKWTGFVLLVLIVIGMGGSYVVATWGEKALTEDIRNKIAGENVRISSGVIHYQWHGPENGPVLVLVHGFSLTSACFNKNVPDLVNAGFRVLTFDLFGQGFSDRPAASYDKDFFDKELFELLGALNVKAPVNLLGHSLGGGVAAVFAARHPELVNKLILAAPAGYMPEPVGVERLVARPFIGDWAFGVFAKSEFLGDALELRKKQIFTDEMYSYVSRQYEYMGWREAFLATIRHYPTRNLSKEYKIIGKSNKQTLVLWGADDKDVPTSCSISVKRDIPNAELVIVPKAGHRFIIVHHEEVDSEIIKFIKQ